MCCHETRLRRVDTLFTRAILDHNGIVPSTGTRPLPPPIIQQCLFLLRRWLIVAAYIISADGLTLNNIKSSGALNYNSPFGKTTTGKIHDNLIFYNKSIFDMNFFFDLNFFLT